MAQDIEVAVWREVLLALQGKSWSAQCTARCLILSDSKRVD